MIGFEDSGIRDPAASEITALLHRWQRGDEESFNRLILVVYQDLRDMARRCMVKEKWDGTMAPTALVHEVYQRFSLGRQFEFESRFHFFRTVSMMMRQILVHYARSRQAQKRGGGMLQMPFDEERDGGWFPESGKRLSPVTLLALDQALDKLLAFDAFKAQVVTLRFIVGLSVEEIALVLDCSPRTVKRSWQFAKHWLGREMEHSSHPEDK